jgi:hypothetical protein
MTGSIILALCTVAGAAFIMGIGVGIFLTFKKMHWLVKWGLVDET